MAKKKGKQEGTDQVLAERPIVEINGRRYQIQPLGLRACLRVIKIFGNGIAVLVRQGHDFNDAQVDPGTVLQIITSSISRNEEDVLALIADVLGVEQKVVEDPEKFPPESLFDIYEAISEHEDIHAFLGRAQKMMEKMPDVATRTT